MGRTLESCSCTQSHGTVKYPMANIRILCIVVFVEFLCEAEWLSVDPYMRYLLHSLFDGGPLSIGVPGLLGSLVNQGPLSIGVPCQSGFLVY